jgi:hypothetical protein
MGATTRPLTRDVFAKTDAMDVAEIVSLFATDARVVFGNGKPMVGVDEIARGTTAFYERSRACSTRSWLNGASSTTPSSS